MESSSGTAGGGELGSGFAEIETVAEGLERSAVFHLVKEILGFVLYMHHQIPAILQQLENEFDMLKKESKNLDSVQTQTGLNATSRRRHNGRIREVKQGIKRMEKLMNSISTLLSALQLMLDETPNIEGVILVLGASLIRPQYVYEMFFSCGRVASESERYCTKSRAAEALSRKAIRALVSNGAGAGSYAGPAKLFLLVKVPATLNLSQHFLPKRDFRYSKKHPSCVPDGSRHEDDLPISQASIHQVDCGCVESRSSTLSGLPAAWLGHSCIVPFRLHIKCRTQYQYMDESHHTSQSTDSISILDSASNDMIWFQCRHTIKGLASKTTLLDG